MLEAPTRSAVTPRRAEGLLLALLRSTAVKLKGVLRNASRFFAEAAVRPRDARSPASNQTARPDRTQSAVSRPDVSPACISRRAAVLWACGPESHRQAAESTRSSPMALMYCHREVTSPTPPRSRYSLGIAPTGAPTWTQRGPDVPCRCG